MIVNIKPLTVSQMGNIKVEAVYIDIQPIPVALDGSDTIADCILGTSSNTLAARLSIPVTKDDMVNWGPDENMIDIILKKLGAEKADA